MGLAYPFCINLSGLFYPRHMNQDGSERITANGRSARSYAGFPDARSAKWAL